MASVIERVVKGGAGFFASNIIRRGLGFSFILITSRILGPSQFGILALGLSVFGVSKNVAAFGLPTTIQRFLSGDGEQESRRIYAIIILIGGVGALAASIALYVSAPSLAQFFGEPGLSELLRALSFGLIGAVGFKLFRAVLQAKEQIQEIVLVDALRSAGKVVFPIIVFVWVQSAIAAAWAVVASFAVALMLAANYVRSLALRPEFKFEEGRIKEILGYSAPLMVVGFSYLLARQADRLMLGWLGVASDVGIYTVASTLALITTMLKGSLVSIFKPIVSEKYREKSTNEMFFLYSRIAKWSGATCGVIILVFAGVGPWVLKIFGAEYAANDTYHVLIILAGLTFTASCVGPTGALLQMTDGHQIELLNTTAFVSSNLILNYILITYFGVIGAAAATYLSGVFRSVLQAAEISYFMDYIPLSRSRIMLLISTSVGIISILITKNIFIKMSIMTTLCFAILVWLLASTKKYEWDIVKKELI